MMELVVSGGRGDKNNSVFKREHHRVLFYAALLRFFVPSLLTSSSPLPPSASCCFPHYILSSLSPYRRTSLLSYLCAFFYILSVHLFRSYLKSINYFPPFLALILCMQNIVPPCGTPLCRAQRVYDCFQKRMEGKACCTFMPCCLGCRICKVFFLDISKVDSNWFSL